MRRKQGILYSTDRHSTSGQIYSTYRNRAAVYRLVRYRKGERK
jgi:hypothetical protein